jgi:hypothetical protein
VQRPEEYDARASVRIRTATSSSTRCRPGRRVSASRRARTSGRTRRSRAHARVGAEVRGPEQGESDGDDVSGTLMPATSTSPRRPTARERDRRGDPRRKDVTRHEADPRRPDRGRHQRGRRAIIDAMGSEG